MQTVSVLLNVSDSSPSAAGAGDTLFTGKEEYVTLLGTLGRSVALGAEAGEDLDEINAGSFDLKVAAKRDYPSTSNERIPALYMPSAFFGA